MATVKRLFFISLIAGFLPSQSFSEDIFGLKRGMRIGQIRKLGFSSITQPDITRRDIYIAQKPKKPRDVFAAAFIVPPDIGLLRVRFIWYIQTNMFGDTLKDKFNDLHNVLAKKYGKGIKDDSLRPGSIWEDPRYWMMGLLQRERKLAWYSLLTDNNKYNLEGVYLETEASTQREARLSLTYDFKGCEDYLKENKKEEF